MKKHEVLSSNGNWKLVVEAWSVNLFFYKAKGVTSNVYERGGGFFARLFGGGWRSAKANSVTVGGSMSSSLAPGASRLLPGSPISIQNASKAEVSVWVFGIGVKVKIDPVFSPSNPKLDKGPSLIADSVSGSGAAFYKGENLRSNLVNYP